MKTNLFSIIILLSLIFIVGCEKDSIDNVTSFEQVESGNMTEAINYPEDCKREILWQLENLCPCGTGKLFKDCCNKNSQKNIITH